LFPSGQAASEVDHILSDVRFLPDCVEKVVIRDARGSLTQSLY